MLINCHTEVFTDIQSGVALFLGGSEGRVNFCGFRWWRVGSPGGLL